MKKFAITGEKERVGFHAKAIAEKAKLAGVCIAGEGETVAHEYSAKTYGSFDDLLAQADADVMVVCSPTGLHAEQIIKSLQAGKDVVVDGVLCLTKAAAWQIIETEKYCRRRLYLIQPFRFQSPFAGVKNELDKLAFKTIYSFSIKSILRLPETFFSGPEGMCFPGGGLLYNAFFPLMDWMVSFFGEAQSVEAFVQERKQTHDDSIERFGVAILKMKSGVLGTLHWSGVDAFADTPTTLTVVTDKGTAEINFSSEEILFPKGENPVATHTNEDLHDRFYNAVYDDLLKTFLGKDGNFAGSLDGAKTVEAIEKIYKACR